MKYNILSYVFFCLAVVAYSLLLINENSLFADASDDFFFAYHSCKARQDVEQDLERDCEQELAYGLADIGEI